MQLAELETPCLVLDRGKLDHNLDLMRARLARLGVAARPHLKTAKAIDVARRVARADDADTKVTVSTLKEADYFAGHGYRDILYAVGIVPSKVGHVARLRAGGCDLKVILDSPEAALKLASAAQSEQCIVPALIEVDTDGHRAGVAPADPLLLEIGHMLASSPWTRLAGVMTHAGDSYNCRSVEAITAMAEQERARIVDAARRLREAGLACAIVSVGSTPTATFAARLDGVTEVRAGVYMFQDLVMAGLGVCRPEDIAISVLTEVIGHQREKNWVIVDAGWMAMSRDRGTRNQPVDQGYGLVCDASGRILDGLIVAEANQEHGIICRRDGAPFDVDAFAIGRRLRILPNHACATAAQYDRYVAVDGSTEVVALWPRLNGW